MTTITMADKSNDGPSYTDGAETERWVDFLDDAARWMYEKAGIDRLSRREVNELLQREIARRRYHEARANGGTLDANYRAVVAFLFVSYALPDEDRKDEGGESDD